MRRRHLPVLIAVLGGLLVGPTAASAAPLPESTGVQGWAEAPRSVQVGSIFRVAVRAPGPRRMVVLQRLGSSGWRTVERERENGRGVAVLRWRAPARGTDAVLRLVVRATADRPALRTTRRIVAVRPAPVATPRPSTAPSATPVPTATPAPAPTPTAVPTSATTSTPVPSTPADPQLDRVLVRVNQARATGATCGGTAFPPVGPLTRLAALDGVAQAYAVRMATEDFFSHTAPDGSTPRSRAAAAGLPWPAENIAAGYPTADRVVDGWLASDGHCRNLMNEGYSTIGLGRAPSSTAKYGVYWVQNFLP